MSDFRFLPPPSGLIPEATILNNIIHLCFAQRKIRIVHRIMVSSLPTLLIVQSHIVWHDINILFPLAVESFGRWSIPMICRLFRAKPLLIIMLIYCPMGLHKNNCSVIQIKIHFSILENTCVILVCLEWPLLFSPQRYVFTHCLRATLYEA